MSDDFVHISDTPVETQTTTPVETQTTTPVETQTTENKEEGSSPSQPEVSAMNEQLGKFFSSILNPESEIKENNDIISNLLGGLLRNLIKNNVNKNEEDDEDEDAEEDEEEDDNEEDESDSDKDVESDHSDKESEHSDKESDHSDKESESDSDYSEMFIIFENKKTYNYATSYPGARRTMLARFHRFLEKNSSNYMRIEKESERIVVYERQPNTLSPYDEQLLYQIEFFSVEKYVDC
jgi:hypothetical protein